MIGSMVGTSLGVAPALLLANRARFVDLDGPLLLARDRPEGLRYNGAEISPPDARFVGLSAPEERQQPADRGERREPAIGRGTPSHVKRARGDRARRHHGPKHGRGVGLRAPGLTRRARARRSAPSSRDGWRRS